MVFPYSLLTTGTLERVARREEVLRVAVWENVCMTWRKSSESLV